MGLRKPFVKQNTITLLVDANILMKRAYNGAKNVFYKEKHIGGIFQFYTILRKLIVELKIDKVVLTWDGERSGSLRLDYYPEYKNNRPKFFDKEYELQKIRVKQYAEELFIRQYEHVECESDDLIAYYCQNRKNNEEVIIYTADRDLCQLISEDVAIYLADKKSLVGIGNYQWYFDHHYKNAGLVKIIEGCSTDNIKGIADVSEKTLLHHFPEIKEREVTLTELINKCGELQSTKEKPLKTLDNIIQGKSKGSQGDKFYEINSKIIDLNYPLLTDDAKSDIIDIINEKLDSEGRSHKNVLKMMLEDGVMFAIPGGEHGYLNFMEPFIKLIKKEKNK